MKLLSSHLKYAYFFTIASVIITPCLSARILGIVPTPSYSHQIVFHPLWRELSLRGHQLMVLTTDPLNNPSLTNLTEINLHFSYETWNKMNMVEVSDGGLLKMINDSFAIIAEIVNEQLEHPQVQAIIKNESEHFDLLMVEWIYPAMYAFSKRFDCPFIVLSSLDFSNFNYEAIGNPSHPVLYPNFWLPFTGNMSFVERLISTVLPLSIKWYYWYPSLSEQQRSVNKHFGREYPFVLDILTNASLFFVNTDPIFHQIRPLVPAVIQIGGGTHIRPPQPLPKDLQKQLDSAPEGFIYFSLGSNVKSKQLSESVRRVILETFSELPYRVFWKFELEDLPGKPDNVIISKWFPQQDVFRHSNIKLFITQGGLQSMEEAIYNHIPIIGMPFIGDQPINVQKIVSKGFGLSVDYETLDKTSFKSTILEVINNPRYRNRVKVWDKLARDQPMTGLDRAIWWTEYVLRHKGALHLRSPAIDLPLYQYFLLDVIGFCVAIVVIALILMVFIGKCIFKVFKYCISKPKIKVL